MLEQYGQIGVDKGSRLVGRSPRDRDRAQRLGEGSRLSLDARRLNSVR